jgi:hypothetical protein
VICMLIFSGVFIKILSGPSARITLRIKDLRYISLHHYGSGLDS